MHTYYIKLPLHPAIQLIGIVAIIALLSFGIYRLDSSHTAEAKSDCGWELSFKSVPVTAQDTLWSIAKENYTENCGSIKEYIREIKRCNFLTSDCINAGSSLLVPIYVPLIEQR